MPNLNTTRQLLEQQFITGWASTTAIAYDNVPFDDTGVSEFVSISFILYTTENVCVGAANTKRQRHTGVLQVKIYTRIDTGSGQAYTYADQIRNFMDNTNQPNLFTYSSETRRNGITEDGWFGLIVDVPFISDED